MAIRTAVPPTAPVLPRRWRPTDTPAASPQPRIPARWTDACGDDLLRFRAVVAGIGDGRLTPALGHAAERLAGDILAVAPPTPRPAAEDPAADAYGRVLRTATLLLDFCQTLGEDRAASHQVLVGAILRGARATGTTDRATSLAAIDSAPWLSPIIRQIAIRHDTADGVHAPRYGQMAGIVDAYAALTRPRPQRPAVAPRAALQMLASWAGRRFDGVLIRSFIRSVGIYPLRTLLRLEGETLGIVVAQHPEDLLHPIVRVVHDAGRRCSLAPYDLDLALPGRPRIQCVDRPELWDIRLGRYLFP